MDDLLLPLFPLEVVLLPLSLCLSTFLRSGIKT